MKDEKALFNFRKQDFDALLFDLDGVITKTAIVHAMSWKKLFDEYLERTDKIAGNDKHPFEIASDYLDYVDGKPRYEGVKSFLESRNITLPWGNPEDSADLETICGLGNRKNIYFNEHLKKEGVAIHCGSGELLALLKEKGFKIAVVTSSKNCSTVLEAAGLKDVFDAQVDGIVAEKLKLKGKPEPDTFEEAAALLGASPKRTAVFEDAVAGVQAGMAGDFGCVIGVDRADRKAELLKQGADLVVSDLSELAVEGEFPVVSSPIGTIPNVKENSVKIAEMIKLYNPFIALDYDGTLTPIVARPELAVLSERTKTILAKVADRYPVAIISGRDLKDIRNLVGLNSIIYAGSHGFDIAGPPGISVKHQIGGEFLPLLDKVQHRLEDKVAAIDGALLERKKFSIALHYRLVAPERIDEVKTLADRILAGEPRLRKGLGKKVIELKPDLDWDKGKAFLWLMESLDMSAETTFPVYIGDDITDEDAFKAVRHTGLGIVVGEGEEQRPSTAEYRLDDTEEVANFLDKIASIRQGRD